METNLTQMKTNEIFGPTIQGEGYSSGLKVMFLRLSGCNLHCVWCDTPYTWNWIGTQFTHPLKFEKSLEEKEMTDDEIINTLYEMGGGNILRLVISGGEPMLQQKKLLSLLIKLKELKWIIEIETNGTVSPLPEFMELVDQINCSPKLKNSDNPLRIRLREKALTLLASSPKTSFKFVVGSEEDVEEIQSLIQRFELKQVYLMPLGQTPNELKVTSERTYKLAQELGLLFSDRLHVTLFGGKRKV